MTPPLTTTLDPCEHGDGCICIEVAHTTCCGALRPKVLASLAAQPAPPTEALRLLRELAKRHDWQPGFGQCICEPHDEARRYLAATEEGTP